MKKKEIFQEEVRASEVSTSENEIEVLNLSELNLVKGGKGKQDQSMGGNCGGTLSHCSC